MSEDARQKAIELVESFYIHNWEHAIICAKICCNKIMSSVVLHGAAWHEYNEIKKELLKM